MADRTEIIPKVWIDEELNCTGFQGEATDRISELAQEVLRLREENANLNAEVSEVNLSAEALESMLDFYADWQAELNRVEYTIAQDAGGYQAMRSNSSNPYLTLHGTWDSGDRDEIDFRFPSWAAAYRALMAALAAVEEEKV